MSGWDAGYASCRDHLDLFDAAATGSKRAIADARLVCYGCPVFKVCDWESLSYLEPDGVWAGRVLVERVAASVFLGVPRLVHLSPMEALSPDVALVDALADAEAAGRPIGAVYEAAGIPHSDARAWQRRFDARLTGADPSPIHSRMKAS